jgi:AAA domain/UvrD-like helicase C-terminal domain/SWIM zinc finger
MHIVYNNPAQTQPPQSRSQYELIDSVLAYALSNELPIANYEEVRAIALLDRNESDYYQAFKALKRHRRKLSKLGLELPDGWEENLTVETDTTDGYFVVLNLSKGTEYSVATDDDSVISCSCPAWSFGNYCHHAAKVDEHLRSAIAAPATDNVIEFLQWVKPQLEPDTDLDNGDRFRHLLDGIELSDGQCKALAELVRFLDSSDRIYLLTGFAGTGKTTLVQAFLTYVRSRLEKNAAFTAFTNKAVKVLNLMSKRWELTIDCLTTHGLLGLKAIKYEDQIVFERDRSSGSKIDSYDLIVVDECSMINEELWEFLNEALTFGNTTKILFVGDRAQIPPVGETSSPTFDAIEKASHLTEVVRYSGSIGVAVESIRNNLESRDLPRFVEDISEDKTEGIWVCDAATWEKRLIKACSSDDWRRDPNFARAIAFTNARVASINERTRAQVYGVGAPQIVGGERLIANSPFNSDQYGLSIQTSDEVTVRSVHVGKLGQFKTWFVEALTDDNKIIMLPVLDKGDRTLFQDQLKEYKTRKDWFRYHNLLGQFADMAYAFAITAHKSQGSTFQNVFLDMKDMSKMPKGRSVKERNQLIYTAATRSAKRLFIYQA